MTILSELFMLEARSEIGGMGCLVEQFKLGESVTVINSPFKGIYGVIVFYDKRQEKYLIRFSGQQQLYYSADEIILWSEK